MTITSTLVDQGPFAASLSVSPDHARAGLDTDVLDALDAVRRQLGPADDRPVQLWIEEVRDGDDDRVAPGFTPYRDLHQLRRPLPAPPSGLTTRAFDAATDLHRFIEVNNRAFSWHPEQAGLTAERARATMAEPWFDANGFRILELEGRMAGFCWTKVHHDHDPPLGEIYVIAIDPDFHGRGLGGPMTLAGLEWLSDQRISRANLFVESDNVPALRTYDRLGFELHSINRAYTSFSTAPQRERSGS